jgi:uncharacterized protein (TIGR02217 family)
VNPFLEERLSVNLHYGWSYSDEYNVRIVETSSDAEYRTLVHPFPRRNFQISFTENNASIYAQIVNLYHRAYGKFAGFRAKCLDDYTTNNQTGAPTALDQVLPRLSAGIYQLQKTYGLDKAGLSIGRPSRVIYKPVAGTTRIAVNGVTISTSLYNVNTTTGQVTFTTSPLITDVVTGGCEFDIPVRFNTAISIQENNFVLRDAMNIELIELISP